MKHSQLQQHELANVEEASRFARGLKPPAELSLQDEEEDAESSSADEVEASADGATPKVALPARAATAKAEIAGKNEQDEPAPESPLLPHDPNAPAVKGAEAAFDEDSEDQGSEDQGSEAASTIESPSLAAPAESDKPAGTVERDTPVPAKIAGLADPDAADSDSEDNIHLR